MTVDGRSHTLERHYATSDFPIAILYKELDRAYPGSKFILTVRNADRWLASVRNHWSWEHNKYRQSWNTDCFTHRLHTEVYGRRTFDADIFVDRYCRHNADVCNYFAGRPDDFLVLNMDTGRHGHACVRAGRRLRQAEAVLDLGERRALASISACGAEDISR